MEYAGGHIGLLVMVMLHRLVPGFIEEGRLYWLKAPISKLETKNKTYYFYNEKEQKEINVKGNITYFKG